MTVGDFQTLGVIGVGNMGSAIVGGVSRDRDELSVHVFDVDEEKRDAVADQFDAESEDSVEALLEAVDYVIVAVKPDVVPEVLSSLEGDGLCVASIAAGVNLNTMRDHLPDDTEIIRIMPNTPAQVGEGMSFLAPDKRATDEFVEAVRTVFESIGEVGVVDEKKMDAVTALSGSGPAYVFYFLEALTEAGVYLGLDSDLAQKAAEQTVYGSAILARQRSDDGPAKLRSEVSSPGGTTVEAIKHLDEEGVKGIFEEALRRACEKSRRLGSE